MCSEVSEQAQIFIGIVIRIFALIVQFKQDGLRTLEASHPEVVSRAVEKLSHIIQRENEFVHIELFEDARWYATYDAIQVEFGCSLEYDGIDQKLVHVNKIAVQEPHLDDSAKECVSAFCEARHVRSYDTVGQLMKLQY